MRLRIGNPRTALIVAPHPDDEVIGAAALIQSLRRGGTRVRVVVVADGAASHPASRRWPRARLVSARRRESRRALARLGVTAGAVRFLGLPDGGLSGRCDRAVGRVVARHRQLGLIVGPMIDDAHPDHRAVAAAIARCRTPARRLGYRVWPHRRGGQKLAASVRMAGGWLAKRSLIGVYRTQLGMIRDDPGGFAIARHELAAFAHPLETFEELRR
ncbi:PIG-L deacetylase family protein [Sphingomonas sp. Tas61C01]|uniref:PIG-L deacetylase family protein n=1 Tax=Sphingomonas sp. Tas61C01 TaxID=3458297 RepID=UPI00403EBB85